MCVFLFSQNTTITSREFYIVRGIGYSPDVRTPRIGILSWRVVLPQEKKTEEKEKPTRVVKSIRNAQNPRVSRVKVCFRSRLSCCRRKAFVPFKDTSSLKTQEYHSVERRPYGCSNKRARLSLSLFAQVERERKGWNPITVLPLSAANLREAHVHKLAYGWMQLWISGYLPFYTRCSDTAAAIHRVAAATIILNAYRTVTKKNKQTNARTTNVTANCRLFGKF